MRSMLPIILVLLAVFTASCIAYIAWDLSSDKSAASDANDDEDESDRSLD